jgi:hypothetical protein
VSLMAGLQLEATAAAEHPERPLTAQEREHLGLPPEEGS